MDKKAESLRKAKEIIQNNGNNFHYEVVNFLRDNGWEVTVSQFYTDAFSQKAREIDIIAEKAFSTPQNSIYSNATVIVRLFIECKYINSTTVFWFDKKNLEKAKDVVRGSRAFHDPDENSFVKDKHHYLTDSKVARLFTSKSEKKDNENDPIYKAITQCINALIYFRSRRAKLYDRHSQHGAVVLNYPLIICNSFDEFFSQETSVKNDPEVVSTDSPLQLEVDYAYQQGESSREELFYVDIVALGKVGAFEAVLTQGDVSIAQQKVCDDRRQSYLRDRSERQNNEDIFS